MSAFFRCLAIGLMCTSLAQGALAQTSQRRFSPSPFRILEVRLDSPEIDAVAVCLGENRSTATARAALDDGDVAAALEALDRQRLEPGPDSDDNEITLAEAILKARSGASDQSGESLRRRLTNALTRPASPKSLACGWLELARLELRIDRVPEARVSATLALQRFELGNAPNAIDRDARFYRAESLARTGEAELALAIHQDLAAGSDPVASASKLRILETEMNHSPTRARRLELERAVTENRHTSSAQWAPRLAEDAITEGDLASAVRWLDIVDQHGPPTSPEHLAANDIRRADILYASSDRNDRQEGLKILRELAEVGGTASIRQLALIREIDLRQRSTESVLKRLERTIANAEHRIGVYAAEVMVRRLISIERHATALEILVDVVHHKAFAPETGIDARLFDEILAALSYDTSCDAWIASVSGRRDLLLRYASKPGPLLRLGDCYQEVGMASSALETYRGIAKTFGPTLVSSITLRSSQAEFELGRLATARAAAQANVAAGIEPQDAWRVLYAEIQLSDGQSSEGIETLRPVLSRIASDPFRILKPIEQKALLVAARAATTTATTAADRTLLRNTLSLRAGDSAVLAEAAVMIADLHRKAGEFETARTIYGPALTQLEKGIPRSRAAYWLGVLSPNPDKARAHWSRVDEDDDPWARLAANEISLAEGRAAVGEPLAAPLSRTPVSKPGDAQ